MSAGLSSWAIRRPIPTLVLFLCLAVAGGASYRALPINANPAVDFPVVSVSIVQPGASPAAMEAAVTRRVEDALAGLAGLRHVTSTVADGVSVSTAEFRLGVDPDRAASDAREAVSRVRADLPPAVEEPVVSRIDVEGGPILYYAVSAPGRGAAEVSWFVDDRLARALLAVPGVQQVERLGGVEREVRVEPDPDRLRALGLTVDQLAARIALVRADAPGGRGGVGGREQAIRALGAAAGVADLAATPLALPDGRWIRLSDVASVTDGASEPRGLARLDGEPVVGVAISRARGSSDTVVAEGVEAAVAALAREHPDVAIREILSTVDYTLESFEVAMHTLIEGALLTVVVVFLFLRDWRATLVAATALPLSILPTFAAMALLGFTLNSITLLALTLVIGILVDDAIVEIENIDRHLAMGKRPFQAAIDAADAIGFAVVAITAAIVAVFLPVSFIGGVVGQYFEQFGVTVAAAVLFSLLAARLLTPLMAAYLLRPARRAPRAAARAPSALLRVYLGALAWALGHRGATLAAGALLLAGSLALAPLLPTGFLPESDRSLSQIDVALPPGTPLAETDAVLGALAARLRERPEVRAVLASAGGEGGGGGDVSRGSLLVRLSPPGERALSQAEFERAVRPLLAEVEDARLSFRGESAARDVSVVLAGADPARLEAAARALEAAMRAVPGLAEVRVDAPLPGPELLIEPRLDEAARLGVSPAAIGAVARVATLGASGSDAARLDLDGREVPIRVALPQGARGEVETLRALRVPSDAGGTVALGTVADIRFAQGPSRVERIDRLRRVAVEADLDGVALGPALAAIEALPALRDLPEGVRRVAQGDAEHMAEMFERFGAAMAFGVLMVFAVLVLLFRDFLQPVTILVALPLSVGGALGGLWLYGGALDLPAVIGLLMLMGIVTKNSILLVEFAIEARREGLPRHDALMRAGRERARPIVMTTLAMIAGMVPAVLSGGADAGFRAPMAVAVIGGLATSTLLSLVFVPVVFALMDDLRALLGRPLGRLTSVTAADRATAEAALRPEGGR